MTCSFLMLVGSAPHHATSPPTSIENEHVVARFRCWWAPHLTMPPHHPPASKMSTSLLVFDAGGLRTSPPPHHHPPPLKMSMCVLVFSVGLPYYCLPPLQTNTRVFVFGGALLLTSPPPAPTIENE